MADQVGMYYFKCIVLLIIQTTNVNELYSAQGQDNVFLCPGNRIDGQDSPIDGASIA